MTDDTNVATAWASFEPAIANWPSSKYLALACFSSERILPFFQRYCQEHVCADRFICKDVIDAGWSLAIDKKSPSGGLSSRLVSMMNSLQDIDGATEAQEVCLACAVLLEMVYGTADASHCLRVLAFVSGIFDLAIQERRGFEQNPEMDQKILSDPEMMNELQAHSKAIAILSSTDLTIELIAKLRAI